METEIKNNEEKRGKLYNQLSSQKEIIIKADVLNSELQLKIQAQNAEINTLKKVILFTISPHLMIIIFIKKLFIIRKLIV